MEKPTLAAEHFKKAEGFFKDGKYAEAIKEYRYVADRFPEDAFADDAQYHLAYTAIYFKNESADYALAAKTFRDLLEKFPASSWTDSAQNWLKFLAQMESLQAEREKLKQDLQRLLDLDVQTEKRRRDLK